MKFFLRCMGFLFIISCKQTISHHEESPMIHKSSSEGQNQYLSCNSFADKTFRGYIWGDSGGVDLQDNCFYMEIINYPKELLKSNDFFLQVFPFYIVNDEPLPGNSLFVQIINKFGRGEQERVVGTSELIDIHFIEVDLELEPNYFFMDHFLKVCNVEERMKGLQLVIYKNQNKEEGVPVRVTKFLLPPFLVNPEHFQEEHGNVLGTFHPFLKDIPQFKSKPGAYFDKAEKMCQFVL